MTWDEVDALSSWLSSSDESTVWGDPDNCLYSESRFGVSLMYNLPGCLPVVNLRSGMTLMHYLPGCLPVVNLIYGLG